MDTSQEFETKPSGWKFKWRVLNVALLIVGSDQLTKLLVLRYLAYAQERVVVDGHFNLVHWTNTGAGWSVFTGNNTLLAMLSMVALVLLFVGRHHFDVDTLGGGLAFGLIFGGILGNLTDRLLRAHVIDFLYFYVMRRGHQVGFPAFNVADCAICTGVGLQLFLSWQNRSAKSMSQSKKP